MKKFRPFIAGVLTTVLAGSLTISALAITNRMTITVDPINVQVNGATFQPKDVNGQDVPVFVYNGTTYAPLRALAEAYGLEVGYDSEKNMATVVDPNSSIDKPSVDATSNLKSASIALVEIDGTKYTLKDYEDHGMYLSLKYTEINGEHLLFGSDIKVTDNGIPTAWDLQYVLRMSLLQNPDSSPSKNPHLPSVLNMGSSGEILNIVTAGVEEEQYLSAGQTYTPMWIEYKGIRVYNIPSEKGWHTNNDIRYYDSMVCINDVLKNFGIHVITSIEQVDGLECLVITHQ